MSATGGGSSAYTPAGDPDVFAWHKADSLALSDGAGVATWADSSGNGNNAVQPIGANQPIFKLNIINGLPVVRSTGSPMFMTIPRNAGLEPNQVSIFAVLRASSSPSTAFSYALSKKLSAGASASYSIGVNGAFSRDLRGLFNVATSGEVSTLTYSGTTVWNGNAHMACAQATGSIAILYGDGTQYTAGSNSATGNIVYDGNDFKLFSYDGSSLFAALDIAELVWYNKTVTNAKRWLVQGYLGNKWAIP